VATSESTLDAMRTVAHPAPSALEKEGEMKARIDIRHSRSCRSAKGGRCDCDPSHRVRLWDGTKRITRTFSSPAEAQGWAKDAELALRKGRSPQLRPTETLEEAGEAWLERMRTGVVRVRGGERAKPSTIRKYASALRLYVYPTLGGEPIVELRASDLQELIDRMVGDGAAAATVHAPIDSLKAFFRHEISRGRITASSNPTQVLEMPAVTGHRDRIADPAEAAKLLEALSEVDLSVWATAMYSGLRRGELRALRASDVDLKAAIIYVRRGWDEVEGEIVTKGRRHRRVPTPRVLVPILRAHLVRTGRRDADLIFGRDARTPFGCEVQRRADAAWKAAKLERLSMHEARHSYASMMIAAGVNAKALSVYMGHASVALTYDTYGHLMPGSEDEAATLLDAYLERAANAG
jgi:integrase